MSTTKDRGAVRQARAFRYGLSALALSVVFLSAQGLAQSVATPNADTPLTGALSEEDTLSPLLGQPIKKISFIGVPEHRLQPGMQHLAVKEGDLLSREPLRRTLRQLYNSGLYENIQVEGSPAADGIELIFRGTPRSFIGSVTVTGAKGSSLNTQLARATQLTAGTRFTDARLKQAIEQMKTSLASDGFHDAHIAYSLTQDAESQLVDVTFQVNCGPRARVGAVDVAGDPGITLEEFRHEAHLKQGAIVDHESGNRAITDVLKQYQKRDRLEAEVKLDALNYIPESRRSDFHFTANQGPTVRVQVTGASVPEDKLKHIVPVFEEGAVDDDLLNEGNRRLRDYFQRQGYFDVRVEHEQRTSSEKEVTILYQITPGPRRKVLKVTVDGNHFFSARTLQDLLSVHAADSLDRHGAYSQALLAADVAALQAAYQNNGFAHIHVTPESTLAVPAAGTVAKANKPAPLIVIYHITEGAQQKVASVTIEGVEHGSKDQLLKLLNTTQGQLLSPQNLASDRDALMLDFLSRGFDQARVEVKQTPTAADANQIDVLFRVHEGRQIFVRNILLTGLHYTRPDTVAKAITLHPGDPLNEAALAETQRNLYEFALFNEVNAAIENPTGSESYKTVLLQATEARRWVVTWGVGFEAQTGTPYNNCANAGIAISRCNPNGKTGISPRFVLDVTRNNLRGREQSASLRGTYGLLEQKIDLLFQNPHFHGNRDFGLTLSGGYANSRDISTYVSSKLEGAIRVNEHFNTARANTMIYEVAFRRVKVAADTLQVWSEEIPELSTAVRVTGPGVTWIRDTRDSLLDAHSGTYTSFQEFLSTNELSAEAQFNRIDVTNSNFFSFEKGRFVLARNTRYGQERAFGNSGEKLLPLPERLYAGGATSHRGFGLNGAGPRDPVTGYPIGGAGTLVNSTELRLPPPTLPLLSNTLSFVLFHDMGNVFTNAGDAWSSALRVRQPHRSTCQVPSGVTSDNASSYTPTGPVTSTGQQGDCSFNYFSHAAGLGLRYHTPVGPIRFDFSYNLNPPYYPAIQDYTNTSAAPHVGQAPHFNFFFSLGQTF